MNCNNNSQFSKCVYLDNCSSTPVAPRVLECMLPYFTIKCGNPGNISHFWGRDAESAIQASSQAVSQLIHCKPENIIWTSGATESNNLAIMGVIQKCLRQTPHIITQVTEHPSVLDLCRELERRGAEVTYLKVDGKGLIDVDEFKREIKQNTRLVSIMAANNEIGTLQPIAFIGKICRESGILFHCDAAQAAGKIDLDMEKVKVDLLSLSGHKMYGPKGIGALCISSKAFSKIEPIFVGGGHQRGLRPGTINVPGVVGLGEACKMATQQMTGDFQRLSYLRNRFETKITSALNEVVINSSGCSRLPHVTNISFPQIKAESLLTLLPDIGAATGSACASSRNEPSHVLRAIGLSDDLVSGSVRFSLGRELGEDDIDYAAERVISAAKRMIALVKGH